MYILEGKDFFNNIRRSVKISHFVASIIPLALLVYFSIKYVYPSLSEGQMENLPLSIGIVLLLAVIISVLGLILTTKATNSSIESAQDLNAKLNSLFDITKQFRETLYLDVLLENIMKSAMSLISAELGALFLYDEEKKLKVTLLSGRETEKMKRKVLISGEGIAARVAESGRPVLLNDVSRDRRFNPAFDRETGDKTESILCVPLISSGETIGVIELRSSIQGVFSKQDEALLSSLADQAGISIAQNRLQEQQKSDFIHITEILVGTQDRIHERKGHARRVAHYAHLIGKGLGISDDDLKRLYYACLFHDIGYMKIDMNDQRDKEKAMHHPILGYDMISAISLWRDSADMILNHHEQYDGKGYPRGRKGQEIPLGARIIAAADAFDGLTRSGSFSTPLGHESAIQDIESHAGTRFDPEVVSAFRAAMTEADLINR